MASIDVSEAGETEKRKLEETGCNCSSSNTDNEDKPISDDGVSNKSDDERVSETEKNNYSTDTDEELVEEYERLRFSEYDVEDFDDPGFENEEHKESHRRYFKQIVKSQGFDVDFFPRRPLFFGGFALLDLSENIQKELMDDINHCLNHAIKQENQKLGATVSLELVDIVKVVQDVSCPLTFLITFDAKDSLSGEQKTYQTKVFRAFSGRTRVRIFREKPETHP